MIFARLIMIAPVINSVQAVLCRNSITSILTLKKRVVTLVDRGKVK